MKISIGTPPMEFFALADTGSDLIWTQCKPCSSCYKQIGPIFNPANSSSFMDMLCSSQTCKSFNSGGGVPCEGDHRRCPYYYGYGDGSSTAGYLGYETFSFNSTNGTSIDFPQITFGCGHENVGKYEKNWEGMVGLGGGTGSLINQLGPSIGRKFSYCLVPQYYTNGSSSSSKLHLGSAAADQVTGSEVVVSTPMILMPEFSNTFYFVGLEALSVGDSRIDYPSSSTSSSLVEGKMIIDSGSTLTMLPGGFLGLVTEELLRQVDAHPVWPPNKDLHLCYNSNEEWKIPNITVHFTGADVELPPSNTFLPMPSVSDGDLLCFSFVPQE